MICSSLSISAMAYLVELLLLSFLVFFSVTNAGREIRWSWQPSNFNFLYYNASCPKTECVGLVPCPPILFKTDLGCERRFLNSVFADIKTPHLQGNLFKSCQKDWYCRNLVNTQCFCQHCAVFSQFWNRRTDYDVIEDFFTCCNPQMSEKETFNCLFAGHENYKKTPTVN